MKPVDMSDWLIVMGMVLVMAGLAAWWWPSSLIFGGVVLLSIGLFSAARRAR